MIVILDNIRSALNVGSILRTCDALGISKVYCCGITPGADNPKVKKTALGAEKNLEVREGSRTEETIRALRQRGIFIYALELADRATPLDEIVIGNGGEVALVVGNEVSGINDSILGLCDQAVMIPMRGVKESLNVAVAFGIAAYMLTKNSCG